MDSRRLCPNHENVRSTTQRRGNTPLEPLLLEQPDHTLQLKDLATLTNGSLSRLSHVVTRLERRGWVRRSSQNRRRATHARLTELGTELGRQKVTEATPGHSAEVRRLVFDVLTAAQVSALEEITGRINATIGAPPARPARVEEVPPWTRRLLRRARHSASEGEAQRAFQTVSEILALFRKNTRRHEGL